MIYYTFLEKISLNNKLKIRNWIKQSIQEEDFKLLSINVILCSDEYILEVNKKFLNHDYYTDVITFDYSKNKEISGDIFISVDRIKENSITNKVTFDNELLRILIHGTLHLCGYTDSSPSEKELMTQKENYYLEKFII